MKRFATRIAMPLAALLLVAAGDPATETEHVVQEGETLRGIANRAGVPPVVIAEANGLVDPYVVKLGQKLQIPRQRSHKVKEGDTGFGIALKYGVPFETIQMANGLSDDGNVRLGQTLIIPAVINNPRPLNEVRNPIFRPPHDGKILLGWRRRPDGGGHDGIDYDIQSGDMIRASASGTVIFAGNEPKRFGKLVVIDHGNGWQTRYGHLSAVTVTKGDAIKAGERLGLGGQSGVAKRPELHFDIRRGGKPVDPENLLRDDL